jgi:hypothetical protein
MFKVGELVFDEDLSPEGSTNGAAPRRAVRAADQVKARAAVELEEIANAGRVDVRRPGESIGHVGDISQRAWGIRWLNLTSSRRQATIRRSAA